MSNDINQLREIMFETLRSLKDQAQPLDVERAKAISNAAQVIINSVKVEIDYLRVSGGTGTHFIPDSRPEMIAISNKDAQKKAPSVAPSLADLPVRVHTIKG